MLKHAFMTSDLFGCIVMHHLPKTSERLSDVSSRFVGLAFLVLIHPPSKLQPIEEALNHHR
jgi:hypothetical protein